MKKKAILIFYTKTTHTFHSRNFTMNVSIVKVCKLYGKSARRLTHSLHAYGLRIKRTQHQVRNVKSTTHTHIRMHVPNP